MTAVGLGHDNDNGDVNDDGDDEDNDDANSDEFSDESGDALWLKRGGRPLFPAHSLPGMIEINTSAEEVLLPLIFIRSCLRYHAPLPVDFHSAQCRVTAVALNC